MEYQPSHMPWRILAITSLAVFAVMLDALVLFVAFPAMQRSFNAVSEAQLSWVLNAYTIVYAALLVPAGRIADLIGRKRIFLAGVVVFTTASVLCGLAASPTWLVAIRVAQAIGGAMLSPTSLALTLAAFPANKRAIAVTLWAAVGAVAVVAGPPLGALIIQFFGWPGIFFLNVPIGIAAFILGQRFLAESRDATSGALPDPLGVVLLITGAALIAFGIVQSEAWGWRNVGVLSALLVGVGVLIAFIAQSRRSSSPPLDLTLFANTTFWRANLATFLFNIAFTGMFFSSVLFLTHLWNFTLLQAGLAITPGPLMVVLGAPIAGRIAARRGHRVLLVPGGILYAAGALLLLLTASATPQFVHVWLPANLLAGLGVALILPILSSAAVQHLPADKLAVGSGVNQAIRQFGTVFGVAITVALLGQANNLALFSRVWVMMIGSGILVSVISLGIDKPAHVRVSETASLEVGV